MLWRNFCRVGATKTVTNQRVAIYVRVSTLDQAREGYSLAAQEKSLRNWCEVHNAEVVGMYADEGISGKDINHRPAMTKMLSDAQCQSFDIILVWALSRFTRSVADLYSTLALLSANGVSLISFTEPIDTTSPMGRAMLGVIGVFGQMEREITSERVSAAMAERAAQGKRTCNEVLGYDLAGADSFVINDEEAEEVRYIFDKFVEEQNLSAVAELCGLHGYRGKRGRILKAEHIKQILSRRIYIGYNSFKGEYYKGDYEPIISQQQFEQVQTILHKIRKPRKNKTL